MKERRALFPVNAWPPFVDALTLTLAAFILVVLFAAAAQAGLLQRLRDGERELARVRDDKARIERRLRALAGTSGVEVDDGKVIVQGEVLFDSGSDQLTPPGRAAVLRLAPPLRALLAAEPDELILVGGHTDDVPIANARFASNWELSASRATAFAKALIAAGLPAERVVASGFGAFHPRAANVDADSRRGNRRIEVLVVPIRAVAGAAAPTP